MLPNTAISLRTRGSDSGRLLSALRSGGACATTGQGRFAFCSLQPHSITTPTACGVYYSMHDSTHGAEGHRCDERDTERDEHPVEERMRIGHGFLPGNEDQERAEEDRDKEEPAGENARAGMDEGCRQGHRRHPRPPTSRSAYLLRSAQRDVSAVAVRHNPLPGIGVALDLPAEMLRKLAARARPRPVRVPARPSNRVTRQPASVSATLMALLVAVQAASRANVPCTRVTEHR